MTIPTQLEPAPPDESDWQSTANDSCTLAPRIIPREEGSRFYSRVCTTNGFSGFDALVETAQNGYQSLDWDYYLALTNCITELEAALPR